MMAIHFFCNILGDHHGYHSEHHNSIASGGGGAGGGGAGGGVAGGGGFGGFGDSFKGFGGFGGAFGGGFGGFGKANTDNRKEQSDDSGIGGFGSEFSLVGPGAASEGADTATVGYGSSFLGAGFRSPDGSNNQTSESTNDTNEDSPAGFTSPFKGLFNNVFGNDLNQGFGGSANNRKGFGFDHYGDQEAPNSQTKPLESPPIQERKDTGFFGSNAFGGSPFGSFGFGSPFGTNNHNEHTENNSDTRSSNASHHSGPEYEGSGFEPSNGFGDEVNRDYDDYSYDDGQAHNSDGSEYYYEDSNGIENNEDHGVPALFPLVGTHSFSDFGDGEKSANALESYNNEELSQGKLNYPNGDTSSGTDIGVTPHSFVPSGGSGFTNGHFGFGTTQTPYHDESGYGGQNHQHSSNDAHSFDAFTGSDLNHPTTVSNDGGSGFDNFSFKKREIPETLHDAPTRKQSRFYPIPNATENEELEQEKPSFASVIGNALPNFREGFGSFR
jgi:hypothetical protein